ncbi:CinA family protein, partial [Candidatus Bipolaricaulota bacterium]|nr:CinA family protein [Candidatus Bipolaricaulota bacterium]
MNLEERLAAALVEQNLTLATAESCTGGGLSHLLTAIPGASAFFIG